MKNKLFWLVVALACLAGLGLMGRDDYRLATGHPVFATGSTVGYQLTTGRSALWAAVYQFQGDDGQLHQVADKAAKAVKSPALDSQVRLVYPAGFPEKARPVALGMRLLGYGVLIAFFLLAGFALLSKSEAESDSPGD